MMLKILALTVIFFLGIVLILKGTDSKTKSRITKVTGGLVSLSSWCCMMLVFI